MNIRISKTALQTIPTPKFIGLTASFAFLYLLFAQLFPNGRLIVDTIGNTFPLHEKSHLLFLLFLGSFTTQPLFSSIFVITIAILIGLNLSLSLRTLKFSRQSSFHLGIGAESFLGIAAAGCGSCGASLLSSIAAGVGIGLLPLQLTLIQGGVLIFLLYSFIHSLSRIGVCSIQR